MGLIRALKATLGAPSGNPRLHGDVKRAFIVRTSMPLAELLNALTEARPSTYRTWTPDHLAEELAALGIKAGRGKVRTIKRAAVQIDSNRRR